MTHLRIAASILLALGILAFIAVTPATPGPIKPGAAASLIVPGSGHGSGFHLGGGLVMTAAHVAVVSPKFTVQTDDGRTVDGEVLWTNTAYDVAMIDAPQLAAKSVPLACRDPFVGEAIAIRGSPLDIGFTTTHGLVVSRAAERGYWKSAIVADATAAPGNSGGPVYDRRGNVVGMLVGMYRQQAAFSLIVPGSTLCHMVGRG